jgi:heterodisulfide reductase subunit A-like polyferredoxin
LLSGRKPKLGTNYYAEVDAGLCVGCARCEDRCHFGAIRVDEGTAVVDRSECVGCGLCAYTCEQESITLKRIEGPAYVPLHAEPHYLIPKG